MKTVHTVNALKVFGSRQSLRQKMTPSLKALRWWDVGLCYERFHWSKLHPQVFLPTPYVLVEVNNTYNGEEYSREKRDKLYCLQGDDG